MDEFNRAALLAIVLGGCVIQFALNAALSPGMEWVFLGYALLTIFLVLVMPRAGEIRTDRKTESRCPSRIV